MFPALPASGPAGIPRFQPPLEPDPESTPIADVAAAGWRHLFAIDCQFPAAPHDTPIPCGNTHRDDGAGSFSGLRRSAHAAGWRMDRLNRMCCPDCAQDKALFTLYPVTFYADGAKERWETAAAAGKPRDMNLEFTLTVLAEMRSLEEVTEARAAGGRHRAVTP
jgi:hypothetical protein